VAIVLDASAALAWLISRTDPFESKQADTLLHALKSDEALVPALWYPEVANGILVAERRGVVQAAVSAVFLRKLERLPIVLDDVRPTITQPDVFALARTHGLSGYDATYLELAVRRGAWLATFGKKLAGAARIVGIRVFGVHP
jgi:predicted nucleic acid-binding protein